MTRWSSALLFTGIAGWVWLLLHPILSERYPLLPFYPAVFLVAWFSGLGPGVLATFLAVSVVTFFSFPPSAGPMGGTQFGIAAFLSIGLSTSAFGPLYRAANAYLHRPDDARRSARGAADPTLPAGIARLPAAAVVGIAAISVAVFGGLVYAAGANAGFFEPSERFHARFENVDGLRAEAPVRLAGVPVGRVVDVTVVPGGAGVDVDLDVARRWAGAIPKDSVARVSAEQLLGRKCVEITPGRDDAPAIAAGGDLATDAAPDVGRLFDQAGETLNALRMTGENLRHITAQVERGHGTVGAVVENRRLYEETVSLVERARAAVRKLEERAAK